MVYAHKCLGKYGYYRIDWSELGTVGGTVEMHIGDSVFTIELN